MATTRIRMLAQGMLVGSLLLLSITGCVRRVPPPEAYVPPSTATPPQPTSVRRFVVTETQQRFYVDSQGRMHHIVREVTQPAGSGGVVYYIENDPRPYFMDESQRLYFRDPSGRTFYIDDVSDIQPSARGTIYPQAGPVVVYPGPGPAVVYPQTVPVSPQSGPGLYYTQPGPGNAVPSSSGYPFYMAPAYPSESCASQYQRCVDACQGVSRREAYTKPQCLSNCETIRANCR